MRVSVQDHRYIAMPQEFGHDLGMHSGLKEPGSEGVADRVEIRRGDRPVINLCFADHSHKGRRNIPGIKGSPPGRAKRQSAFLPSLTGQFLVVCPGL